MCLCVRWDCVGLWGLKGIWWINKYKSYLSAIPHTHTHTRTDTLRHVDIHMHKLRKYLQYGKGLYNIKHRKHLWHLNLSATCMWTDKHIFWREKGEILTSNLPKKCVALVTNHNVTWISLCWGVIPPWASITGWMQGRFSFSIRANWG